jgi:hypothetical protein
LSRAYNQNAERDTVRIATISRDKQSIAIRGGNSVFAISVCSFCFIHFALAAMPTYSQSLYEDGCVSGIDAVLFGGVRNDVSLFSAIHFAIDAS